MARSRLSQALDEGAVSLPEGGTIAVIGPPTGFDLSMLDQDRVRIAQAFKPDHEIWASRGYDVGPQIEPADAAIVCLPRSRIAALDRISQAQAVVPSGAPILVDGQKDDGIDAILKRLRAHTELSPSYSKSHGKIAQFHSCPLPAEWRVESQRADGFSTCPGAFSADGIDLGSAALVSQFAKLKGRVADLGAGWGYLSSEALKNGKVTALDLVEADYNALECARLNVVDPRAEFYWADAGSFVRETKYDFVISNPPFHTSRKADPSIGRAFIGAAAQIMTRGGTFLMVANRHLPYEMALADTFSVVEEIPGPPAFKLISARRPRTKR